MKPHRFGRAALLLAGLVLAGCGRSGPSEAPNPDGIDPAAPVAAGHAALPLPGEPTPLTGRALSGLYASPPSADTLEALSTAPVSPDGLFRAVLHGDELWVTRIDGAWLWQVTPPPVGTPSPADAGSGAQPGAGGPDASPDSGSPPGAGIATAAQAGADGADVRPLAPIQWTPRSTLLFRDTAQRWLEADPETALVTPLSAFLTGATSLIPSPDGSQVLFYKENRLYTARWDGSQPQLVGESVVGHWDSAGRLVVTERPADTVNPD
ncbi:hypothetical protein [Symbiobacterium thermophilum]|uniref:hypothetical protein n=1 Tax=Symbiobacterium thermophilum TaxID=2734 RepID=UPI0035C665F1